MEGDSNYKVTLIGENGWFDFSFDDKSEAFDHAETLISNADGPCSVKIENIEF